MTTTTVRKDAAHQVQVTVRSPGRVCDVTTAIFVISHTSVEIFGWVVTRLVTALKTYFPGMTSNTGVRDAAHNQVEVTVRSPVRE